MKINDIAHTEARAWVHGYLVGHDLDRATEPSGFDREIEWHLQSLIVGLCPYSLPELPEEPA